MTEQQRFEAYKDWEEVYRTEVYQRLLHWASWGNRLAKGQVLHEQQTYHGN